MDGFQLDPQLISMIERCIAIDKSRYRQVSRMLNQAMKEGVQDHDYLEQLSDILYDIMVGATGKGERLMLRFIRYVTSFDKAWSSRLMEQHIEDMGYKYHVVFAAAHVAKKWLHNDHYKEHVVPYMQGCYDWKQKAIALLTKIPLWTDHTIDEAIVEMKTLLKSWQTDPNNLSWAYGFDDDINRFPADKYEKLSKAEWNEIAETAKLLSPQSSTTVEEFYESIKTNLLALRVRQAEIFSLLERFRKYGVPDEYQRLYQRLIFESDHVDKLIRALVNDGELPAPMISKV